jgi:hypothetical protein
MSRMDYAQSIIFLAIAFLGLGSAAIYALFP